MKLDHVFEPAPFYPSRCDARVGDTIRRQCGAPPEDHPAAIARGPCTGAWRGAPMLNQTEQDLLGHVFRPYPLQLDRDTPTTCCAYVDGRRCERPRHEHAPDRRSVPRFDLRDLPAGGSSMDTGSLRIGKDGLLPTPPAELARAMREPIGVKHDGGKLPWEQLPWDALREVVKVLAFGARKYAPLNWQKVEPHRERYFGALQRHLVAWWEGERADPETGLHHLAHAICCALFLLWFELRASTQ